MNSTMTTRTEMLPAVVRLEAVYRARTRLQEVALHTPLQVQPHLSEKYGCEVWLKREDLQPVRSYKIRGAYNKMATLTTDQRARGVVCASAGNHAQGVAWACLHLHIRGRIFMPSVTPKQKVDKVRLFGREAVEVILTGDTFDDAYREALACAREKGRTFIHPFDDLRIIEGQATIGLEILDDCGKQPPDLLLLPIGGGGVAAGVASVFRQLHPDTTIIGVEPAGAPAMYESFRQGRLVSLSKIDPFVDGAAVRQVGQHTFHICHQTLDEVITVPEGLVCSLILDLYNEEGIVVEPAGALTTAALRLLAPHWQGKKVVCLISGSNNDITRMEEIKERAMLYEGLKHYFLINFAQRPGALREFLNHVLGPDDDITRFEYTRKNNRERGPALVGIELKHPEDYQALIRRMKQHGIGYQTLNDNPMLFEMLV